MLKVIPALALAAASLFAADEPSKAPRLAPELAINLVDGSQKLLSSYRGKVVCVAFVFTTCPHCQNMMLTLGGLQKEYAPKGVQFLASAFNGDSRILVPEFEQKYVHGFPVGWNEQLQVLGFLNLPATVPYFVPILVFIDRKGIIREQYIGDENYLRMPEQNVRGSLDRLLAFPGGAALPTVTKRKTTPTKAQ